MDELLSEEEKARMEERERKKAEVRARLEAESASSKSTKKKGFMTPERKKKLRLLLRKKAAEELKLQQEAKAAERRKVIAERTGPKADFESLDEEQLVELCKEYHAKICQLESSKYDLEYNVGRIDFDIHDLSSKMDDMRGKFIKPTLRKVPKFNLKIEAMLKNARKEVGFTVNLKAVKRNQQLVPGDNKESSAHPEWSWKNKEDSEQRQPTEEPLRRTSESQHGGDDGEQIEVDE